LNRVGALNVKAFGDGSASAKKPLHPGISEFASRKNARNAARCRFVVEPVTNVGVPSSGDGDDGSGGGDGGGGDDGDGCNGGAPLAMLPK